jgi:chorismate mutase
MRELGELRNAIDKVDDNIITLIKERMDLVKEVGANKVQNKLPALDIKRWNEVILKRREYAISIGVNPDLIERIYNLIHEEALKEEEIIISK